MHLSLRDKLVSIVGATAATLALLMVLDLQLSERLNTDLEQLERRLVPKVELEPRLMSEFEHLGQALKDAVAAQDRAAIDVADEQRASMFALIDQAGAALEPDEAMLLRQAIAAYHRAAVDVSLRLLDGETGTEIVTAMDAMQVQYRQTVELIQRLAGLDKNTLGDGFAALGEVRQSAARQRLSIGLLSLSLVIGLSVWLGRGALRSLRHLSDGFDRFARGKLDEPISAVSSDELGALAESANRMAAALLALSQQRDAADWIKAGQVELADELRGDMEPARAARVALEVLARRLEAPIGALYVESGDGEFELAASLGASTATPDAARRIRLGEGLAGEALLGRSVRVIEDVPPGYCVVRSGLGEATPPYLVLVPLCRASRAVGLVELGLFRPCTEAARELLGVVCESLAAALDSARSRARLSDLLEKSRALAARLSAQEQALIENNSELTAQQEELRLANDELEEQRASLRAQNAELEQTRARLQENADELSKVSSYKSQFLANMSHELRTPLNSMLLLSQILADNEAGNLTPKQIEHCRTIYTAGKGLLALINQVLDLSRIEAGKQQLEIEAVPLREAADHLRRVFEPELAAKGLDFSVVVEAEQLPATIETDGQRLHRILVNLLGNALKFTHRGSVNLRIGSPPPGARLERSGLDPAQCVAFEVRDTGVGIPAHIQEHVFARFEQADATTVRRYGGTGLGLSIARESAQLMGGELQVQSVEGHGSTFTCYLPERLGPADPLPARLAGPAALAAASAWVADDREALGENEPYLLVVEDEAPFAEQLVEAVRSLGLRAIVAPDGREALRLARARAPAGVVLDVKLPDIDGFEVRQQLLADPSTAAVPIHFISALDPPLSLPALQAVGYLEKPASRDALVNVIQSLIWPRAARPAPVLVVEDDEDQSQNILKLLDKSHLPARVARNADETIRALESTRFCCVIMDLGLPDADGLELLEKLRARADLRLPPVIVHTARRLSSDESRRLRDYAQAVVLKEGRSGARLLDEVQAFVGELRSSIETPPPSAEAAVSDPLLQGTKVLIADDDMRTVYALSALLRSKGADVVVAESGSEALRVLEDEHSGIGAVLMDIMMPDMDGYEAMRRLREQERFADLPVIALTARAVQGERERCERAGASDYMTKPIDPASLLSRLKSCLAREEPVDALP